MTAVFEVGNHGEGSDGQLYFALTVHQEARSCRALFSSIVRILEEQYHVNRGFCATLIVGAQYVVKDNEILDQLLRFFDVVTLPENCVDLTEVFFDEACEIRNPNEEDPEDDPWEIFDGDEDCWGQGRVIASVDANAYPLGEVIEVLGI